MTVTEETDAFRRSMLEKYPAWEKIRLILFGIGHAVLAAGLLSGVLWSMRTGNFTREAVLRNLFCSWAIMAAYVMSVPDVQRFHLWLVARQPLIFKWEAFKRFHMLLIILWGPVFCLIFMIAIAAWSIVANFGGI